MDVHVGSAQRMEAYSDTFGYCQGSRQEYISIGVLLRIAWRSGHELRNAKRIRLQVRNLIFFGSQMV